MATQAERRTSTRTAIIEAAYTEFVSRGAPDVALETIGERAGVTKGSIHYHFTNRAGLLAAVAEWVFEDIEDRVAASASASGTNDATAVGYVRALLHEQATPVGRVLFTIGDELLRTGDMGGDTDPYRYLCARLRRLGITGEVTVVAAAVMQFGRHLAFGQAEAADIEPMLDALVAGGTLPADS